MTTHDESILSMKIDPRTKALLEASLEAQSSIALFPVYLMAGLSSIIGTLSWIGAVGVLLNIPHEAMTYGLDWYAVAGALLLEIVIIVWALAWSVGAVRCWRTIKLFKTMLASQPNV